jgi:4-hydroxy-3-methylbut-2-enyl diphosphate reductase
MIKFLIGKESGFCFGIKRAMSLLNSACEKGERVYSLGEIVHNREVVKKLKNRLTTVNDIREVRGRKVIIRTHGVGPRVYERLKVTAREVIDATCPFVKKAQKCTEELRRENYKIVIVGNRNHPEVKALREYAGRGSLVIKTQQALKRVKLKKFSKIGLLAQTTVARETFSKVALAILSQASETKIFNTICQITEARQKEALRLAKEADLMIVIGGKNSSNTKILAEICGRECQRTYLIETPRELRREWFRGIKKVGVAGGTSSPDWLIEEVIDRIKSF